MAQKNDPVDVSQLAKKDLSETAFPAGGKQDFRIFFDPKIHQRIAAHAAEKLSTEICGVLVGKWHRDASGPFVLVDESIRCDKATSNAGDVTFTHEAWNTEIYPQMDKKFTDREIVGWYHSHPNYGIFLSDRDCFIQEHYFNGPGHIAYVVDPVNGVEGVFALRNGKSKLWPHFWVGDEIHLSSQGTAHMPSSAAPGGQPTQPPPAAAPKPEALPPLSTTMTWILGAVCFLLLGYLAGSKLTAADRFRTELGTVALYGDLKCLKLGMREDLDQVNEALQKITHEVDALAVENIKSLAGDAAEEKKKQWIAVVQALVFIDKKLQEINNIYSLTPEQAAEVQQIRNAKEAEMENVRVQAAKDSAAHDLAPKTAAAAKGSTTAPAKPPEGKPAETNKKQ